MSDSNIENIELPRKLIREPNNFLAAPSLESFTSRFGNVYPAPEFLESDLGTTAVYDIAAPSGDAKRRVLLVHGLNTPALGLLPLAKALQRLDPDAHVVFFDLWGHGLSSTPLVAHTAHIFHSQIFQVLAFKQWTSAHLLGYSFGASMLVKFAVYNRRAVDSVALLAPAGVIGPELFSERTRDLLRDSSGREAEAKDAVFELLGGGSPVVPDDWRERIGRGEAVPEAFQDWELKEHPGHRHSVFSMFREGNTYGTEDYFRRFAQLPLKQVVVLGETDNVCSKDKLTDLGFTNVEVVKEAGHGVVRKQPEEVARIVYEMWSQ
ncbi:alpha/beta-hydrolase [Xylaria bambusicola]|uniref:alpha/beta-hydrolase n=1 Tax=Xylaria bambusicola TaxID=326684 RepID=UPI0020082304|nr:alpha/beta-hydrolase [Xylaria bambusicola]KAI0515002.1 alpha/beta-hydrolase [Xylaria bambusicola]